MDEEADSRVLFELFRTMEADHELAATVLATYLGADVTPQSLTENSDRLVARMLHHRAGAAPLAELEVLVGRRGDEVRRLQDRWRWHRGDVSVAGPRPLRVKFDRGGERIVLLGSALALRDPDGRSHTFVLVPLAAFEGERSRSDDPLALLPGAPRAYGLAPLSWDGACTGRAGAVTTRASAVNRWWNVALLRVDDALAQACDLGGLAFGDDAMPSPAMSWVRTADDDAVWCHVTATGRPTRADVGAREVVPVLPAGGVKWLPEAPERLSFAGEAVQGWLCGSRFIPARALMHLASEAVIRDMPWRRHVWEILSALLPKPRSRFVLVGTNKHILN